jgi:outer membrane protein assembly factor BamB
VGILWRDKTVVGSPYMLGCSSNSETAVCSFGPVGLPPYLRAYNGDGDILWSYFGLGPLASISAPMIDELGRVIAADNTKIVMLDNDGSQLWVVHFGLDIGVPISPVIGLAVVTTTGGYIVSVDALTGKKVGQADFFDVVGFVPGFFATRNTPAVSKSRENRLYSVNEFGLWV